ncbi:hypothetical protein ACFYOD_06470 [Streptomyces sp. NPDC006703]|uniref:hypothetical protein n=1 Tax=Streptomyces sp. NPDC006703 TaxID=3364759 RepID=UPI003698F228
MAREDRSLQFPAVQTAKELSRSWPRVRRNPYFDARQAFNDPARLRAEMQYDVGWSACDLLNGIGRHVPRDIDPIEFNDHSRVPRINPNPPQLGTIFHAEQHF